MRWLFATVVAAWLAACAPALAQVGQATQCGPTTATSTAQNIVYPSSGGHGPTSPQSYVTIINTGTTTSIWVNATGQPAVVNDTSTGSFPLVGQGNSVTLPPMPGISVIASSTEAMACFYQ